MAGEILVGAGLLLGLLTRFSTFIGLFMLINYYLGPGMARGVSIVQQQIFIVALIIIFLSNAGRSLGLDGLLLSGKGKGAR